MIRTLAHTLGSRLLASVFNLALLLITTKLMGAENKGAVSLLVLNLSIAAVLSGLFGGPSLVYLVPRYNLQKLTLLAYGASFTASLLIPLLSVLNILPSENSSLTLFGFALMECLIATHLMLFLGLEKVKAHNVFLVLKAFITVGALMILYVQGSSLDFDDFVFAYGLALVIALISSFLVLLKPLLRSQHQGPGWFTTMKESAAYGFLVQTGNIAQLMNYRLSFYFLELLISPPSVALIRIGIYSASLQVAESLWQFARSVSTVQYSKVANMEDRGLALSLSLDLGKLNYLVTCLGLVILVALPDRFYSFVFGAEFGEIRVHVLWLSLGIFSLSISNALSHYFSGVGDHKFNTQSSILGFVLTIAVGYPSIMYLGTTGAAMTASIVYTLQTIYQIEMLKRSTGTTWRKLLPTKNDGRRFLSLLPF